MSIRKLRIFFLSGVAATAAICSMLGFTAGPASAEPKNPGPAKGNGCIMANGRVLQDGELFQTPNGQIVWCTNGQVCHMGKTGQTRCGVELGTVPPRSAA
jgi:hypothetical protein